LAPRNSRKEAVVLRGAFGTANRDRDFLREVLENFRQEFPPLNMALNDAVARKDLEQIQIAADTLTAMLANLSFTRASAMRIGRMARDNAPDGILDEMACLERNVTVAQAELETLCREVVH
jgi:hypothetical protein